MLAGIQDIGWRFYIIFAVTNFLFIPVIWLFYPETAGLSLDEIDRVFTIKYTAASKMTYQQATSQARDEFTAERLRIADGITRSGGKQMAEHVENL
jgi:hypothetical protein